MTKTQNYSLPQWEATDALQRGDFNEAMESIDTAMKSAADTAQAAWTDDNKPYVTGSVSVSAELANGGTVVTFDFEPGFVLLYINSVGFASQGGSTRTNTNISYIASNLYYLSFQLSGTNLILYDRGSNVTSKVTLRYMAFR